MNSANASTATQCVRIVRALRKSPMTALDALRDHGVLRLAARIHEIRKQGVKVQRRSKHLRNGKTVAEYYL